MRVRPVPQMFTIKCDTGVKAASFKADDKVYISTEKLLPMARFLPQAYVPHPSPPSLPSRHDLVNRASPPRAP